jgi:hypothetical protein
MSEYDPFNIEEPSEAQRLGKHFLGPNGLWLFVNYSDSFLNEKCLCGCIRSRHIANPLGLFDGDSICLNSQCLCEGFVKKEGFKINIPSKKSEVQVQEVQILSQKSRLPNLDR